MHVCTSIGAMRFHASLILVQVLASLGSAPAGPAAGHPRNYAAPRAAAPIQIDGNIYKKAWEDVPWSEDFVEIRGDDAPEAAKPTAGTRTRAKMLWDDDFLYIATEMSAQDWPITAEFTKRNEPIYQKDSDIEVFLDTDGSNHNYKELEVNARNTVWNLLLNRPYSSGGSEHSGREAKPGDKNYWDVKAQKTAAKMYGAVGKRQSNGKWTAEIALSHKDSLDRTGGSAPAPGKFWRINFSRVEKKGAVNWVWSPQMIWTPAQDKYVGQVNMHAPDGWGYVVFAEAGQPAGTQKEWVDPNWNVKAAAHQLFYAETYAKKPEGGGKLLSLAVLQDKKWVTASLFKGLDTQVTEVNGKWSAVVKDGDGCASNIQQDNLHTFSCSTTLLGLTVPPLRYAILGFGTLSVVAVLGIGFAMHHRAKPGGASD